MDINTIHFSTVCVLRFNYSNGNVVYNKTIETDYEYMCQFRLFGSFLFFSFHSRLPVNDHTITWQFINSTDVHFSFDVAWSPLLFILRCWSMMSLISMLAPINIFSRTRIIGRSPLLHTLFVHIIVTFYLPKCSFAFSCFFLAVPIQQSAKTILL